MNHTRKIFAYALLVGLMGGVVDAAGTGSRCVPVPSSAVVLTRLTLQLARAYFQDDSPFVWGRIMEDIRHQRFGMVVAQIGIDCVCLADGENGSLFQDRYYRTLFIQAFTACEWMHRVGCIPFPHAMFASHGLHIADVWGELEPHVQAWLHAHGFGAEMQS